MTEFLTTAVGLILAMLGLGLVSILRGPADADRMMAAQLIGTAGIAVLLLIGTVTGVPAAVDVALILALLATFASIAFVKKGLSRLETDGAGPGRTDERRTRHHHGCGGAGRRVLLFAGTVGLLRFPDTLTRLHALSKADNLGLGFVVLGLLPQTGGLRDGLKLISIWMFVLLAGATVSQLIARAARQSGSGR